MVFLVLLAGAVAAAVASAKSTGFAGAAALFMAFDGKAS